MKIEELIRIFLEVAAQARLYHWQTESFAEHETFGEFYEAWVDLSDKFVESYAGMYGRPKGGVEMKTVAYTAGISVQYMQQIAAYLQSNSVRSIAPDTPLQNILDELGGLAARTAYQLTLKK
jgi:hypothetical protein